MKPHIALDVGIGYRRKRSLEYMGYKIVVVAAESESDDSWVNRAFAAGARFVVSPDLDIPKIIELNRYPMIWINYPSNDKNMADLLVKYIDDSIGMKLKLFKELTEETAPKVLKPVPLIKKSKVKLFLEKYF